jgi:hypothetical protein
VFAPLIAMNGQITGSAARPPDPEALREGESPTVSSENPEGFKNDPDDPTNPNEAIERSRRKLRPSPLIPPSASDPVAAEPPKSSQ